MPKKVSTNPLYYRKRRTTPKNRVYSLQTLTAERTPYIDMHDEGIIRKVQSKYRKGSDLCTDVLVNPENYTKNVLVNCIMSAAKLNDEVKLTLATRFDIDTYDISNRTMLMDMKRELDNLYKDELVSLVYQLGDYFEENINYN